MFEKHLWKSDILSRTLVENELMYFIYVADYFFKKFRCRYMQGPIEPMICSKADSWLSS